MTLRLPSPAPDAVAPTGAVASVFRGRRVPGLQGLFPRLLAGLLLLNLLVVLLAGWSLSQSRRMYRERVAVETRNLARLLDHDISTLLQFTDRLLQSTVTEVERRLAAGRPEAPALNAYIERQMRLLPDLNGLRVADAQGTLRYGRGLAGGPGPSIADRPYFQQLQREPGVGVVLSPPVLGRVSGLWALSMARAVRGPDGRYAGAVVASIPLTRFAGVFGDLAVGPGASFTLFNDDLQIVVRHQDGRFVQELVGMNFGSPPLQQLMRDGAAKGTYQAVGSVDGVERVFSYGRLPYGLSISVGRATTDYLAQWRAEAAKTVILVSSFVLMTLLLSWFVYRGWQRQTQSVLALEQTNRTLDAEKQLNQTIIHSSPFAIYTRDRRGVITAWNPAAEKLFGWTADQIIGWPLPSVPPGRERESEELRDRVLAGESIIDLEVQRQKRDGTLFDLSTTLAPLRDADGMISGYLAIAIDITARKAAEKKIEFLAYRDVLTGLPNRMLLRDRFEQALAHADRAHTRVALLFLDLDNFKTINDSLGHAVGDALLKEIATRLGECVRETDTISRQGGDEFLIVLPDLRGTEVITPILIKIRERLQAPIHSEGHELTTSASIGVSLYPDDGRDFETLLRMADTAMYRAKEAGRNQYRFFDEQMNVEAVEQLRLKNGLWRALAQGEFELHYQPQIELASGRVTGAEALLRWRHPEQGLIDPVRFIPVAEECGLIVTIGEWVLHEACCQAMAWRAAGLPPLLMAVNLSAVQFRRGEVEQTVAEALQASGLEPQLLELELTESILIRDTDASLASVRRLKQMGVKLAIDDFGTGYSSLSYLKRFDIDKLKIDRSFVRDLATDPDDAVIVRAIIQMAVSLNLRTLAEGVEDEAALAQLRRFACDEAQGYYFARPMNAADFASFVAKSLNLPLNAEKAGAS
jgi:diguanylate cyclase (GGDEF)-like protein/PAS domain S-box-containing protein